MENFINELSWRGMINDITPYTKENFGIEKTSGYIGFDPTADSLHIGNLAAIMMLKHLQNSGHRPIILIGGFTGMIGDPSGKSAERNFLNTETLKNNIDSLKIQFEKFIDFDCGKLSACIVNNNDWIDNMKISEFMRQVGKYVNINYMLSKESVKSRKDNGLSFTEFSYQLFQAFDFYWLYDKMDCKLQMGGADQWGNITSGNHLIKKRLKKEGYVITCPLITKSDGTKFGKTENGNIWLDKNKTSIYDFYQFWLNVEDKDLLKLFKVFTMYNELEITDLFRDYNNKPRELKKILAIYMTSIVHTKKVCDDVVMFSNIVYGNFSKDNVEDIKESSWNDIVCNFPISQISINEYQNMSIYKAVSKVFNVSQSESKRLIINGGIKINNKKIVNIDALIKDFVLLRNEYLFFKKGKTSKLLRACKT